MFWKKVFSLSVFLSRRCAESVRGVCLGALRCAESVLWVFLGVFVCIDKKAQFFLRASRGIVKVKVSECESVLQCWFSVGAVLVRCDAVCCSVSALCCCVV